MKKAAITLCAIAGLTLIAGRCVLTEKEQKTNITRIDYFDGSFEITRIIPNLHFKHNELKNYDILDFQKTNEWVGMYDAGCDGVVDTLYINGSVYYPNMQGTEKIFEKANKTLAGAKLELGIQ